MTAGTPSTRSADSWTFELWLENAEGEERRLQVWNYAAMRAAPQVERVADIHCVTRWSKLDTRWRGVDISALLKLAGVDLQELAQAAPPIAYAQAHSDGGYSANLKLADLVGGAAMIALEFAEKGAALAPLDPEHGGPARLLAPKLYFWKSAKWVSRLVLSPFDRKGYWERLGYHNYGDPWREQRYRGISDGDWRRTLDPELSRQIREERKRR
ncbi:MAG: molybdopterin-dependent oxidoreductase [Neomegalonema sp.]|nr:molybdopterin-dependent oxidoreductase [Neomegalonema sp.]